MRMRQGIKYRSLYTPFRERARARSRARTSFFFGHGLGLGHVHDFNSDENQLLLSFTVHSVPPPISLFFIFLLRKMPPSVMFFLYFGQIAQSVEQRTENPCVAGSIPVLANFFTFPIDFNKSYRIYCSLPVKGE